MGQSDLNLHTRPIRLCADPNHRSPISIQIWVRILTRSVDEDGGAGGEALIGLWFFVVKRPRRWQSNRGQQQCCCMRCGGRAVAADEHESESESSSWELFFKLQTLQVATNSFSDSNKLGHGGFGAVNKGLLPNGQEVAIKKLSLTSRQGIREFSNEVKLLLKIQHKNLVMLIGCCIEGPEKMLVYEYLPNKSLDYILFDKHCIGRNGFKSL